MNANGNCKIGWRQAPKSRLNSKSIKVIIICLSSGIDAFVMAASRNIIVIWSVVALGACISDFWDWLGLGRVSWQRCEVL